MRLNFPLNEAELVKYRQIVIYLACFNLGHKRQFSRYKRLGNFKNFKSLYTLQMESCFF